MQSQLTVRLPDDLDREVSSYARRLRVKRSDVVRMALERFLKDSRLSEEQSPYELVSTLLAAPSRAEYQISGRPTGSIL